MKIESHVQIEDEGAEIVGLLAAESGMSRRRIKDAMQKGAVWHTGAKGTRRVRRQKQLSAGDQVHLYYDEDVLGEDPTPPELVSDEGAYSVWNKPYGMRSQGSKWGDHCTITRWAEGNLKPSRPAFIVHRLDRAASGLILVAHEKKIATRLSKLFETRSIEKRYRVLVHGKIEETDTPILIDQPIDGREARSRYQTLGYDEAAERSEVEIKIETGRKHQIRIHMASLGFPVVGDRLYGRLDDSEDLQLKAVSLSFVCPVENRRKVFEIDRGWSVRR